MKIPPITIEKQRLPAGQSYVLRTSLLEPVLAEADGEWHVHLIYQFARAPLILRALFWLPNPNVPYERLYVTAGAVASGERRFAADCLTATVLPALAEWVRAIRALPRDSPELHAGPFFAAEYSGGSMRIRSAPPSIAADHE